MPARLYSVAARIARSALGDQGRLRGTDYLFHFVLALMAHLLHLAPVMRIPLCVVWVLGVSVLACDAENVTMDSPADANNDTSAPDAALDAGAECSAGRSAWRDA